jgi:hypothetical protein
MDLRKKRTIVINFLGGPSSGKSLLAALTFAELKLRGKICEYVQEYAKTLVWLKKFELLNDQYFVSSHQNDLLRAITSTGKVDYIITDGPLLNGLYYNRANPDNVSAVDKTEKFILDRYAEYDNFNIFLHRGSFPYEQEGRLQTLDQAKEVDRVLLAMLQERNIPVMEISSSPESVKIIVDTILGVVNPTLVVAPPKPVYPSLAQEAPRKHQDPQLQSVTAVLNSIKPTLAHVAVPPAPQAPALPPIPPAPPIPAPPIPAPPIPPVPVTSQVPEPSKLGSESIDPALALADGGESPQSVTEAAPMPVTMTVPTPPVVPSSLPLQAPGGSVFSWPLRK